MDARDSRELWSMSYMVGFGRASPWTVIGAVYYIYPLSLALS